MKKVVLFSLLSVLVLVLFDSIPASAVYVTHTPSGLTPYYRAKVFVIERIGGTGGHGNRYLRIQTADEGKVFGIEVDDPGALQAGDRIRITNDNRLVRVSDKMKAKMMGAPAAPAPPAVSSEPGPIEYRTNRPGSDYRDFKLSRPDPYLCRNACMNDSRCLSWTYVRPGITSSQAHCWLKDSVPRAESNPDCTSGRKIRRAASKY